MPSLPPHQHVEVIVYIRAAIFGSFWPVLNRHNSGLLVVAIFCVTSPQLGNGTETHKKLTAWHPFESHSFYENLMNQNAESMNNIPQMRRSRPVANREFVTRQVTGHIDDILQRTKILKKCFWRLLSQIFSLPHPSLSFKNVLKLKTIFSFIFLLDKASRLVRQGAALSALALVTGLRRSGS